MSEIKWAYDESTGSFSALPASAFLLPCLGLLCLAPLAEKIIDRAQNPPQPLPIDFDHDLYNQHKQRYYQLIQKRLKHGALDYREQNELDSIMRPPWAEPGELWTY